MPHRCASDANDNSGKILVLPHYPSLERCFSFSLLAIYQHFDGHSRSCTWHLEVSEESHSEYLLMTNRGNFLVTAAAEAAGKLIFAQGLSSSFRPRKYYTIPREALEASLEDVEQLVNFFVIEFQRVLFAENIIHTVAVSNL